MAEGIKISELPEIETLQDGCCFPVISEIDGTMQNVKIKKVNLEKTLKTNKYSTEETIVGEWIDGKPIYRKVFDYKSYSRNELLLTNVHRIIDFNGWAFGNNTVGYIKIGTIIDDYVAGFTLKPDGHNVKAYVCGSTGSTIAQFTIEYTKESDY